MSTPKGAIFIPDGARERAAWVLYQLKLRGTSLARVAEAEGTTRRAAASALRVPSFRMEQAIARALGVPVQQLFPERYDAAGNRLHIIRRKPSTRGGGDQRRTGEAA